MWPKIISVRGVNVEVSDWDEVDEVIKRYGTEGGDLIIREGSSGPVRQPKGQNRSGLEPHDLTLLRRFVEESSLATADIGSALGKSGKAIKTGMVAWSVKVGLARDSTVFPFESCFRADGRGYKLLPHFREVGRSILDGNG